MNAFKSIAMATVLAASTSLPVLAADNYSIDSDHTWVGFSIGHAGWANAHGQFRKVSGDIVFDQDNFSKSKVSVVIDATSVDTNHEKRDQHVTSGDFLNTSEFSKIVFESNKIEKTGDKTFLVHGKMTLAGVSRDLVLDAQWNSESPLPWDPKTIKTGFSATTTINGADFGMSKLLAYGIGPDIHVQIDVEAVQQ